MMASRGMAVRSSPKNPQRCQRYDIEAGLLVPFGQQGRTVALEAGQPVSPRRRGEIILGQGREQSFGGGAGVTGHAQGDREVTADRRGLDIDLGQWWRWR